MIVFGQSGRIQLDKMVVFGQNDCFWRKWSYLDRMVVFGQNCRIWTKRLGPFYRSASYLDKSVMLVQKCMVVFGKSGSDIA